MDLQEHNAIWGTIKTEMFMILPIVWFSLGLFLAWPESICERQTHRHAQTHEWNCFPVSSRVQCWIWRQKRQLRFNLCSWAKEEERKPMKGWPWNQETWLIFNMVSLFYKISVQRCLLVTIISEYLKTHKKETDSIWSFLLKTQGFNLGIPHLPSLKVSTKMNN